MDIDGQHAAPVATINKATLTTPLQNQHVEPNKTSPNVSFRKLL